MDDHRLGLLRAALLPALARLRARRLRRRWSSIDGQPIEYAAFVAPALLAASAFNGAFYDATNIFWKLRYAKTYDAVLVDAARAERHRRRGDRVRALPRADLLGRLLHGHARARARRLVVGGAGAARDGLHRLRLRRRGIAASRTCGAGRTSTSSTSRCCRCSSSRRPSSRSPSIPVWLEAVVQLTPLYHAVSLLRGLTTGAVGLAQLVDVAYLVVLGYVGMLIAARRIEQLLLI